MQRYRKGQMFRPPTTNESAQIADAVEGFRMRPPRPQVHSPSGQSMIVKTPEGGIPAVGDDGIIHWVLCERVIQKGGNGDREAALVSDKWPVYNLLSTPIPGGIIVATALTECNVQYVVPSSQKALGKLDEPLEQGGSATVSIWAGAGGSETDTNVNVTAFDWLMKSGASDIAAGKKVIVTWINDVPYITEAECP